MAIVKLAEVASKLFKTFTAKEEENSSSWLYVLHEPWHKEISRSGLAVIPITPGQLWGICAFARLVSHRRRHLCDSGIGSLPTFVSHGLEKFVQVQFTSIYPWFYAFRPFFVILRSIKMESEQL